MQAMRSGSAIDCRKVSARASTLPGGNSCPFSPSQMAFAMPPLAEATTGTAASTASRETRCPPSPLAESHSQPEERAWQNSGPGHKRQAHKVQVILNHH